MVKHLSIKELEEKESVQRKFGKKLAAVREEKNITQETLAFELGVDRTYVSYIERGKRNPSLYLLSRIASTLNIRLHELVEF